MIIRNNKNISGVFKGNTEIINIYKGDNVVYIKSRLPKEFQEVEYFQRTGEAYINTNFIPNNNTKIKIKYMLTKTSTQCLFGARTAASSSNAKNGLFRTHGASTNRIAWGDGDGSNVVISGYNSINTEYEVFYDKNKVYINNNTVYEFPMYEWSASYPIYIGCVNTKNTGVYYSSAKYYYCKIWDNNTLVRDLIPCYRKSDNVVGMYDLVNDEFYTSSGSGSLVLDVEE